MERTEQERNGSKRENAQRKAARGGNNSKRKEETN